MDSSNAKMTDVVIRYGGHYIQIVSVVKIEGLELPKGINVYYEPSGMTIKFDTVMFNGKKLFDIIKNQIESMGYNVVGLTVNNQRR